MAAFEPQRAAITTKEAVFRVIIQEKMTEIWEVDYTYAAGRSWPVDTVYYYRTYATHESDENHETQSNRDAAHTGLGLRHVKCGQPFTIIRNMDAM